MVSRSHYCCPTCFIAIKGEHSFREKKCSSCGGPMVGMGKHFKAPRKANKAQWRKVALVLETAFEHHPSCVYHGRQDKLYPHYWCRCPSLRDTKSVADVKSGLGIRRSRKKNWAVSKPTKLKPKFDHGRDRGRL